MVHPTSTKVLLTTTLRPVVAQLSGALAQGVRLLDQCLHDEPTPQKMAMFAVGTRAPRSLGMHVPAQWMRYQAYRRQHLPIGSGITEAACKIVFTQRLKHSGMAWTREGGQVILDLRVVWLSGVWEAV